MKRTTKIFFSLLMAISLVLSNLLGLIPFNKVEASISDLSFAPSGSTVGTCLQAGQEIARYTPSVVQNPSYMISLTFPTGTTISTDNIVNGDFTVEQVGTGGAEAVSSNSGVFWAPSLTVTAGSDAVTDDRLGTIIVRMSSTASGNEICFPATSTSTGTFSLRTALNGTGTLNNVSIIPDTPIYIKAETEADGSGTVVDSHSIAVGSSETIYAIARDQYGNFVSNIAADSWDLSEETGSVTGTDLVASEDLKSAVITGNTTGSAKVGAIKSGLTSTYSGTLYIRNASDIHAPETPIFDSITANYNSSESNHYITIAWSAPTDEGSSTVDYYQLQYKASSSSEWITYTSSTITDQSVDLTIGNLNIATSYDVRMSAISSDGQGDWSTDTVTTLNRPQISSFSPTDDSTNIAVDSNLEISFTQNVAANSGRIYIYNADEEEIEYTVNLTSEGDIRSISTSEDTQKIIMADYGNALLSISNDDGETFHEIGSDSENYFVNWRSTAMSSDGSYIIAGTSFSGIFLSDDGGDTWSEIFPAGENTRNWQSLTMSSTGEKMAAATWDGNVYFSSDYGETWSDISPISDYWTTIAMSDDGEKMVVGSTNNALYITSNDGESWTEKTFGDSGWTSADIDSDGSHIIVTNSEGLWLSTNSGQTFTNFEFTPEIQENWYASINNNGSIIAAASTEGEIYYSSDTGSNWQTTETNQLWSTIKVNQTGTNVFLGSSHLYEFDSSDQTTNELHALSEFDIEENVLTIYSSAPFQYGTNYHVLMDGYTLYNPNNYLEFIDGIVGATTWNFSTVAFDTTAPVKQSFKINNDETHTNNKNVTLSISATDDKSEISQMMVSSTPNFTNAVWETYSTTKAFVLSDTDGEKNVYIKFKDSYDNISSIYSDSIILDTTVNLELSEDENPINTDFTISNGGRKETYNRKPRFSGTGEPLALVTIVVHSETIIGTTYVDLNGSWSWTPSIELPLGDHEVIISIEDQAGNVNQTNYILGVLQTQSTELAQTGASLIFLIMLGTILILSSIQFNKKVK